jgi:hypothetical protein
MAEIILSVDSEFGGLHIHLSTTTTDFTKLALGGVGSNISGNWNDRVSSFKIISGTWRFFRDINLHDAFTSPNGQPILLGPESPGTPNALNSNHVKPGEWPVLPQGFDNDQLSSVELVRP